MMMIMMATYWAKVAGGIIHPRGPSRAAIITWEDDGGHLPSETFIFPSLDHWHLIHLIHLPIFPICRVPSSRPSFTSGTSDWIMPSMSLPRSFTMLMMLRTVMKESSNETRMHENKFYSKMRIVERQRQGNAVMRYSLSWKRGHMVYLIYGCPLLMVLVRLAVGLGAT